MPKPYIETFDNGPGGWMGWISNAGGPKPLLLKDSAVMSSSPWWIDYNHAPPGAGYLHMLAVLLTKGPYGEAYMEAGGPNGFLKGGFTRDFTSARLTFRVKGELEGNGANLSLLVQATVGGVTSAWILSGQPIPVTSDWTSTTITTSPDPKQWTSMGARHDRADMYGHVDLARVLADVNCDIMLVMFPLNVVPMGPIQGDPHRLRPERDYPVWRSRLPEGYVLVDEVQVQFA